MEKIMFGGLMEKFRPLPEQESPAPPPQVEIVDSPYILELVRVLKIADGELKSAEKIFKSAKHQFECTPKTFPPNDLQILATEHLNDAERRVAICLEHYKTAKDTLDSARSHEETAEKPQIN